MKPLLRHANGQFQKGSGGRQLGSRNKLQGAFIDDLLKDYTEHGAGVIRIVRAEKPTEYLKIVASILPKEFMVAESEIDRMTDEELLEALEVVRQAKAANAAVQ